jgi:hypothetical protein
MPAFAGPPPVASVILPVTQDGFGTDPNGFKRPPRPPSTA